MKKNLLFFLQILLSASLWVSCSDANKENAEQTDATNTEAPAETTENAVIQPLYVTEPTTHDTDDPAIWIHPEDPSKSLIVGTDKEEDGALYVFDLTGKIVQVVKDLKRPNNVDIIYGLSLNGTPTDIAVAAERLTHKLRIFRLPDMTPVDGGGIEIFVGEIGEGFRDLMGIALYKKPETGQIYAIAGRKNGPTDGTYLWQYLLEDDGTGAVKATLARKFGKYSGTKEIEAIAVDQALGYVYCSDETVGVRKYYADPEKGNEELALFATEGFARDHEGISIYTRSDGTGYILVSDQQAAKFHIFKREGEADNPHAHTLVRVVNVAAQESDGSEITSVALNADFPKGVFVAMSDNRTFHLYKVEDILGELLD